MKKLLLISTMIATLTTSCLAESRIFFEKQIGQNLNDIGSWRIAGRTGDSKYNAACSVMTSWNDGSAFYFVRDLIDGEVYIEFKNNNWNVSDPKGTYNARINFKYSNNSVQGADVPFDLINKNTVMFRNLNKDFTKNFFGAIKLDIIMPGTIPNAFVPLAKTREALGLLSQCIDASKNHKLEGATSGPSENI